MQCTDFFLLSYLSRICLFCPTLLPEPSLHLIAVHHRNTSPLNKSSSQRIQYLYILDGSVSLLLLSSMLLRTIVISEYFKESGLGAERWAFVPYRDLLQDVESTVVNLLTQFRYMDADSHSRAVHGDGDSNGGAANSPCPHDVNAAVNATVTAPQSNICETGANDVLVGSSVSQYFGHPNTSRSRGRSRSVSTTLGDLLRKEKQRKGEITS